jgi:hypothetical protein
VIDYFIFTIDYLASSICTPGFLCGSLWESTRRIKSAVSRRLFKKSPLFLLAGRRIYKNRIQNTEARMQKKKQNMDYRLRGNDKQQIFIE